MPDTKETPDATPKMPEDGITKSTDDLDTMQIDASTVRQAAQAQSPQYRRTYGNSAGSETSVYKGAAIPPNGQYAQPGYTAPPNGQYAQPGYIAPPNGQYAQPGYTAPPNGQYAQPGYTAPPNGQYAQPGYTAPPNGQYAQPGYTAPPNGQYAQPGYTAPPNSYYQQPPRQPAYQNSFDHYQTEPKGPYYYQGKPENGGGQQQNKSRPGATNSKTNHTANNTANTPPRTNTNTQKQRQRSSSRSLAYRIIRIICIVIVAIFLLYSAVALFGIFRMDHVSTGDRSVTDGTLSASYVKNVLVIGTDSRDPSQDGGRSDSMILLSINSHSRKIYMTSFMRDAYVEIPGNGSGKLNSAYSYGGAELLMDTIEYNYGVDIDDYVLFTFEACADMIDAVGGVELTISDREAEAVNEILISEVNGLMGDDRNDDLLESGGTLKLDGKQALSYSRIRYVGNADFERTERQRTVMQQVITKVLKNPLRIFSICMMALPDMVTNISAFSLYGDALTLPFQLISYDLEQLRIPDDSMYWNDTVNGESVLRVDFDAAYTLLQSTVYAS